MKPIYSIHKHTFITSIILLIAFSCKKVEVGNKLSDGNAFIEGYVINPYTKDTLGEGFEIEVWEDSSPDGNFIEQYDGIVAKGSTNQDGYFKINYKGTETYLYAVRAAQKENYYLSETGSTFGYLEDDPNNSRLVGVYPYSWMRFDVKNEDLVNATDTFYFLNFEHYDTLIITGAVDTTMIFATNPILNLGLYHVKYTNENEVGFAAISSQHCPSLDTCVTYVNY